MYWLTTVHPVPRSGLVWSVSLKTQPPNTSNPTILANNGLIHTEYDEYGTPAFYMLNTMGSKIYVDHDTVSTIAPSDYLINLREILCSFDTLQEAPDTHYLQVFHGFMIKSEHFALNIKDFQSMVIIQHGVYIFYQSAVFVWKNELYIGSIF